MRIYRASVRRDGDLWFIAIPEISYATQARTAAEVETMTRDVISIMTGTHPDSFGVHLDWPLPEEEDKPQDTHEEPGDRQSLGPFYGTAYAARWLWTDKGGCTRFPDGGRVLALTTKNGERVYPGWQFRTFGMAVPHLPEIVQILSAAAVNPWTVANWLRAPDNATGGTDAVTWLDSGGDPEPVLAAAREDADRWTR